MRFKYLILLFLFSLFITSCSSQWHHPYNLVTPKFNLAGSGSVTVIAYDNRSKVADGSMLPQQVGEAEQIRGEAVKIYTASGLSLAEDISAAVCNGMKDKGYKCDFLIAKSSQKDEHINFANQTFKSNRIIYLSINDWFAQVFINPRIKYAFDLEVWNPKGEPMSALEISGEDKIPIRGLNPAQSASTSVPKTMQSILESMFNHQKVASALTIARPIDELGAKIYQGL
jgi:hypothetical protein